MAEFVADCPRCGAIRSTHDTFSSVITSIEYSWQQWAEIACICRTCHKMSVHLVSRRLSEREFEKFFGGVESLNSLQTYARSLNDIVKFERHLTLRDKVGKPVPEHLPIPISQVVSEGNIALANQCWNAAGAMYRLALDLATKSLLPEEGEPAAKIRRNLGLRMPWLFDKNLLPNDLRPLAECIQQDGNDGAHDGTLSHEDAEDLHDFCF
jgi:hypothetical protein